VKFPKHLLIDPPLSVKVCTTEKKQSRHTGEAESSLVSWHEKGGSRRHTVALSRKLLTAYDPASFGPFRPHAMHHVLHPERACTLQMLY
jgi:hypothetical protein